MNYQKEVVQAETRIRKYIRETPLEYSPYLSELGKCRVYLKLENLQLTGSFKVRGAMNKILSLPEQQWEKGIVAASTGNHGMAVAYAAKLIGVAAAIYMAYGVSETKIAWINSLGGKTLFHGYNCLEAETKARQIAQDNQQIFISPYNDPQVIAGQGTIGMELLRQLDRIDTVFVTVGGGGLVSGIASCLKATERKVRIVGCWPHSTRGMFESLRAGRIVETPEEPTISDSTSGGVERDSITFDLCSELIDDYVLVSELEILQAMKSIVEKERWIVEGAAGVAVAAYLKERKTCEGQNVIILLCGRNITADNLRGILSC
jgi:threonine dehydratase